MAIYRYFRTNDRPVVLFAESEPGIFSHVITTDDSARYDSSGTSMKVAAVGIDPTTVISAWSWAINTTEIEPNFLECTASYGSATYPTYYNSASYGDLTVIDDHGAHIGTQNCTNSKCYYSSSRSGCVGVMHTSTDDGWIFKGWRVSCESFSAFEIASSGYDRTLLDDYVWELESGASDEEKNGALVLYGISSSRAITIEAVYEEMPKYSVSFNLDGGTGDAPTVEVYVGDEATIPDYTPTKSGYIFLGWATTQGASVAEYEAGDSFVPNQDIILYAVWQQSDEPDEPDEPGGGGGSTSIKGFICKSSTSDFLIFSSATGALVYY